MKEVEEMMEYVKLAEEFRPVVLAAVEELRSYGPALTLLLDDMNDAGSEALARRFNKLVSLGFTRDEAMLFTIDARLSLAETLRRMEAHSNAK